MDEVAEVLTGHRAYDDLRSSDAQACVRQQWARRLDKGLSGLDLASRFDQERRPYAELVDGRVVVRQPSPPP